jgi:dTDP-4-dehydrorhamnose reductase
VRPAPRRESDLAAGLFDPRDPDDGAVLLPALTSEDAPADPRSVYALSKLAQEHLAATWARAGGGAAVALRYHNVYGPGMPRNTPYAGVAALFASAVERGEAPQVFEDGRQRRSFVHVDDVAAATVLAAGEVAARSRSSASSGSFRAFNVGGPAVQTILDVLADRTVDGITANVDHCRELAESSPSIVTPLNKYIGYEEAAKVAKQSLKEQKTIRQVVVERGYVEQGKLTEQQLDEALDVLSMTHP